MPSGSDFFDELKGAHDELKIMNPRIDGINVRLDQISIALNTLLTFTAYTDQALFHNALQNDTIICILEKIARSVCDLVNQAHLQTALQTTIQRNTVQLADLFAATHAEAALTLEREQVLRQEIERCCPPTPSAPPCRDEPCAKPGPLPPPPVGGTTIP
jgi:hypothetical protein